MTLLEQIMQADKIRITREMWAAMGRGELDDDLVEKLLAEGYEACVD